MTNFSKEAKITLREITNKTLEEICHLEPKGDQKKFVASNAKSIEEAKNRINYAWLRAIYADDVPVGFVMIGLDPTVEFCFLWRFMIDKRYQKRGFGKKALQLVIKEIKSQSNSKRMITSYKQGEGDPSKFYESFGFTYLDKLEDLGELGKQIITLKEKPMELKI